MRRYWWLVLAIVWLAVIGGVLATVRTPTTYIGRTSMIVASNDRSPDQDAVLVQGYVTYFNDPAYQRQLVAEAGLGGGTTTAAQAAAASPILVITATGPDGERAQSDSIAVARVFGDDINAVHVREAGASLATLQNQLDTVLARNARADQAVIAALQDRIREVQADQVNVLQELQLRGGVTVDRPPWMSNLALALVAGLFLGVAAALALARLSPRLRSRQELADKVGISTLAELSAQTTAQPSRLEERGVRQLANVVRGRVPGQGVVTITQARDAGGSRTVAQHLAVELASQGFSTVLVRFVGHRPASPMEAVNGSRAEPARSADSLAALSSMKPGPVPGMAVVEFGSPGARSTMSTPARRLTDLLRQPPLVGALVIIEAATLDSSASAQAASMAADAAVLAVDPTVARVEETREAVEILRASGVTLLGAVLVPGGDRLHRSGGGDDFTEELDDRSREHELDTASASARGDWSW